MKKNEKVFRVPKNYCLFLAIKTFDRCQKERKRRRENRVRAYAMAREERRTPRSLRRVCYFRFVGSGGGGGGGGGRVSPTSWSFYRLLCRRLYEQLLKPFWSYEGLYWTQWTLWNSRRWPVTWREANNVNCRFNPPPPTYKSAQLWAHLPVNKTYKLPGDFETPPDITLLPCSDYNWTPHWIQFITTFKWSLIKNQ